MQCLVQQLDAPASWWPSWPGQHVFHTAILPLANIHDCFLQMKVCNFHHSHRADYSIPGTRVHVRTVGRPSAASGCSGTSESDVDARRRCDSHEDQYDESGTTMFIKFSAREIQQGLRDLCKSTKSGTIDTTSPGLLQYLMANQHVPGISTQPNSRLIAHERMHTQLPVTNAA